MVPRSSYEALKIELNAVRLILDDQKRETNKWHTLASEQEAVGRELRREIIVYIGLLELCLGKKKL